MHPTHSVAVRFAGEGKEDPMAARQKYLKRVEESLVAIQLDLDTAGFTYRKWGDEQTCKPGDWIVNNGGDVYTVSNDAFTQRYQAVSPGLYRRCVPVWAEVADCDGEVDTHEGKTRYLAGDYLVYVGEDELEDGYAVERSQFEAMYEPAE